MATFAARLIPIGLWAAAEGLAIAATANNDIKENCLSDDTLAVIETTANGIDMKVDVNVSSRASQASVDTLQASIDTANAKLDSLQASVNSTSEEIIGLLNTPQGQSRGLEPIACNWQSQK